MQIVELPYNNNNIRILRLIKILYYNMSFVVFLLSFAESVTNVTIYGEGGGFSRVSREEPLTNSPKPS